MKTGAKSCRLLGRVAIAVLGLLEVGRSLSHTCALSAPFAWGDADPLEDGRSSRGSRWSTSCWLVSLRTSNYPSAIK
jgi:hypothetical protein